MGIRTRSIFLLTRCALYFIKLLSLGSGSTWPGHIALKLHKNFIKDFLKDSNIKVILIAGTNGKTTTSTLLKFILEKKGNKVIQNEEGANMLNGVASTLLRAAKLNGKINADYAIFEIDENTLPLTLLQLTPTAIILLNLFRDQLDRYGEVNTIAYKWSLSLKKLTEKTSVVLNGDDPQMYYLGVNIQAKVYYFGLEETLMQKKEISHDVDSNYCPKCGEKLQYHKLSYSHLGDFYCESCGFKRSKVTTFPSQDLYSNLKGIYNLYNISAVATVLQEVLHIPFEEIKTMLPEFRPAFGRQEVIQYKDREIFLLLSKNPTGFNQSIEAIKEITKKEKANIAVLLNDRIPDGKDISWIWDVDFENLLPQAKQIFVSGDRTYDMALRFKYALEDDVEIKKSNFGKRFSNVQVIDNLKKMIEEAVEQTVKGKVLIILSTYSAMLDTRKILLNRELL